MSEFDLSNLKKGSPIKPNQPITRDREMDIPIPPPKSVDPIFDTPPVRKIPMGNVDSNFHTIEESNSTTVTRTPVLPGKPPRNDHTVRGDASEPVDDPQPLKIMNNMVSNVDSSELTPFDINSLPKKKKPEGEDERDAYDNLEKAVEAECKSISERVKALTQKQYDELLEARESGQIITPPDSDEQTELKLRAEVEAKAAPNDVKVEKSDDEILGAKHIIIADEEGGTEIELTNQERMDTFCNILLECVQYIRTHVLKKDAYTKVLYAKTWLAERKGIYAPIYCIVMYDREGNTAVHPILAATRDDITAVIEVNETGAQGVYALNANDTIESVCGEFVHKGLLYDYIDFTYRCIVVKMPVDTPPNDALAIKIAENPDLYKSNQFTTEVSDNMEENKNVVEDTVDKDLDGAIDPETDREVTEMVNEFKSEDPTPMIIMPEPEEAYATTPYGPEEVQAVTTYESAVEEQSSYDAEEETAPSEGRSEDEDSVTIQVNPLDSDTKIIEEGSLDTEYESISNGDIEKDLEKELNPDGPSDEQLINELKTAVRAHSNSIRNRINLRNFTISDTPISAAMVANFSFKDINQADWVLPNAKRVISVRGLSGPELFAINPQNSNKSKINTFRQIYGIIYKHITSKKPATFDEWLKVTRFSDIDHIYAALHKATFADSNFIHYECPECHHIFIVDYKFDDDMVVYDSDKAKEKIQAIYRSGDTSIPHYEVTLHQISDRYVVGLKDPSIWNMVMETAALSDDFLTKYEDLIDTMSFIDSIYLIGENNVLQPIDFGYDKNNPTKSTARKITILSDIIRTLSSDNYFILRSHIAKLYSSSSDVLYQIPATDCPKCKHHFNAERTEALRLLFTRHQLGALESI